MLVFGGGFGIFFIVWKDEMPIFDVDIQGFEEFSFGDMAALFAAFDAIDGQDGDTCFACEFSFADHLLLAYFFEIVFFSH